MNISLNNNLTNNNKNEEPKANKNKFFDKEEKKIDEFLHYLNEENNDLQKIMKMFQN